MGAERGRNRCCGTDMHTHSHFSVLTHSLNIRFVWAKPSMAQRHPNLKTQISHSIYSIFIFYPLNSWTTIHRPKLRHLHLTHPYLVPSCLSSCSSFLPYSIRSDDLSRRPLLWFFLDGRMTECLSQLPRTQPVDIEAERHKLGSQGRRGARCGAENRAFAIVSLPLSRPSLLRGL